MKEDKKTTTISYFFSIVFHLLLFLIFAIIPKGEPARATISLKTYYPVEFIIEERKIKPSKAEVKITAKEVEKKDKKEIREKREKRELKLKEKKKEEIVKKIKDEKGKKDKEEKKEIAKALEPADIGEHKDTPLQEAEGLRIKPGILKLTHPRYTKRAENLEIEGIVELTVISNEKGTFERADIGKVEVTKTSGNLDAAKDEISRIAMSAVRRGQYSPMSAVTIVCLFKKVEDAFRSICNEKK